MEPSTTDRPTIGDVVAQYVEADTAHLEVAMVSIVADQYFSDAAARRRATGSVLARSRRQTPAAFGDDAGPLVVQTVLVVLTAVALGALGDRTQPAVRAGWWTSRRFARRLASRVPAAGQRTPMPTVDAERAGRICAEAAEIGRSAGLDDPAVARLVELIRSAIIQPS